MSKRRSWQPALGLLIGFAAVAGVVASTQNHPAHQPLEATLAPRSPSRSTGEGLTLARPFLHGVDMTLSEATQTVHFNIPRPNDPLASDEHVTHVWVDMSSGQAQIQIVYSSGVYVQLGAALSSMADAQSTLEAFTEMASEDAAQTGGQAQVVTVKDSPAYLVPENSVMWANGESQGGPGCVELVTAGEVVDVVEHLGNGDLLRIASTVGATP